MTTFQLTKNIRIEAEGYSTRYSWGHKAYLYINEQEAGYKKITYYNRTWESYTYETILWSIVEDSKRFTNRQKKYLYKVIKNWRDVESERSMKMIANIARMGELLTTTQKESNDWKSRMLKAGLSTSGLIMPEDWDTLSEDEKTKRLDGAIAQIS